MKKIIFLLILFPLIFLSQNLIDGNEKEPIYKEKYMQDANKVALGWLSNINHNNLDLAYGLLNKKIKSRYDEEDWTIFMRELMTEFGDLRERVVNEISFKSKVEGEEDGFYVFIEYKSNYSKTKDHYEFLMLKQNYKANWEIGRYWYEFKYSELHDLE